MKDSMVISDMLYILQHFNTNYITFLLLILSCSITIVQHLRFDYCENFELARKETIDKLKWNKSFFFKYYRVLSKHCQPSCSIVNVRMQRIVQELAIKKRHQAYRIAAIVHIARLKPKS